MEKLDELIVYNITDAAIAEMKNKYTALTVKDVTDTNGFLECRTARMVVRDRRIEVEKRRKELKSESLSFGRKVDDRAKEITKGLTEIEDHLQTNEDVINNEKKRIQAEVDKKDQEKFESRINILNGYKSYSTNIDEIKLMSDEEFDELKANAKENFETLEREATELREQAEKTRIERDELLKKQKVQDAENQKLKDELIAKQRADHERDQKIIAEKEKSEAIERKRRADEQAEKVKRERILAHKEAEAKAIKAEEERVAAEKIADKRLFNQLKASFPTLETAWVEIARLRKKIKKLGV